MIIDNHVHAIADTPDHGQVSEELRKSLFFRLLRWRLGIRSDRGEGLEREAEQVLIQTVDRASSLEAAVVLALDAVYDPEGQLDLPRTVLHVGNEYVAELAARHPKLLFGASIHPYRRDALQELERCLARGAVLLKWLPIVQDIDPSDERCFPLYEAMAHHRLPLLCHTGGERALPNRNKRVADPVLLVPALQRGVTVIAAHCGTRDKLFQKDYLPVFARLVREHANLYGDTAALSTPFRSYAYDTILTDEVVRQRLVHGSDWPIMPIPPRRIGWFRALHLLLEESNWMERDVQAKRALGLGEDYWHRAATLLRIDTSSREEPERSSLAQHELQPGAPS